MTPTEPSIKEDENENGESLASNGHSRESEPAVTTHSPIEKESDIGRYGCDDVAGDADASVTSQQQSPASTVTPVVEQSEKKEEKYVNDLFKVLLGELSDVFGVL